MQGTTEWNDEHMNRFMENLYTLILAGRQTRNYPETKKVLTDQKQFKDILSLGYLMETDMMNF